MRQRYLRRCRRSQRRRHAGHNLIINVRLAKSLDLLTCTAEDHRVAGLQADYLQTRVRESNHQKVDLFLLDLFRSASLADVVQLRRWRNEFQYLHRDQFVIQDSVCGL